MKAYGHNLALTVLYVLEICSTAEREMAFQIKFEFAMPHVKGSLGYISQSGGTLGRCGLS